MDDTALEPRFRCLRCAYRTWDVDKMAEHFDRHRPSPEDEQLSAECPTCFVWRPVDGPDNFWMHVLAVHPESPLAADLRRELAA